VATPELDALASRSFLFENFIAAPAEPSLLSRLFRKEPQLIFLAGKGSALPAIPGLNPVAVLSPGEIPAKEEVTAWFSSADSATVCIQAIPAPLSMGQIVDIAANWSLPALSGSEFIQDSQLASSLVGDLSLLPEWKQKLLHHAAHVQSCDALLSRWFERLEEALVPEDVVIVTALSGEESRIPDQRPAWLKSIAEPMVHFPLIIHHVERARPRRWSQFLSVEDASDLILDFARWSSTDLVCGGRESIRYESSLARGIRTQDWLLVEQLPVEHLPMEQGSGGEGLSAEPHVIGYSESEIRLYLKPQDYWNMHDVSREFPDLVEACRRN